MLLDALLGCSNVPRIEVTGMTADSRNVQGGDLFVAVKGNLHDGHAYVDEAISKGARCILTSRPVDHAGDDVAVICDPILVSKRNQLAARLYGDPSRDIACIGVTGTNGKTSVAFGLAGLLRATGFAGTPGWGMLPNITHVGLTTMDGVALQACMASMRDQGAQRVAMEVSSHALSQGRVSDVRLQVGIYTNISRDHLDYHGSMAAYESAKRRMFEEFDLERAVINIDDALGRKLEQVCIDRGTPVTSYSAASSADINFELSSLSIEGARGLWRTKWGSSPLRLPVRSEFGIANCAAILATLVHFGTDLECASRQLAKVPSPPGRFEFVRLNSDAHAVIDYAHTPDALRKSLVALRRLNPSALICVFGCGGDRDRGKRSLMGAAAEELADRVIVTNDNPRTESPNDIADAVLRGMKCPKRAHVELDRESAIRNAVETAPPNGIVLIAGKGAEEYQEVSGVKQPFSDRDIVDRIRQGGRSATLVD